MFFGQLEKHYKDLIFKRGPRSRKKALGKLETQKWPEPPPPTSPSLRIRSFQSRITLGKLFLLAFARLTNATKN